MKRPHSPDALVAKLDQTPILELGHSERQWCNWAHADTTRAYDEITVGPVPEPVAVNPDDADGFTTQSNGATAVDTAPWDFYHGRFGA